MPKMVGQQERQKIVMDAAALGFNVSVLFGCPGTPTIASEAPSATQAPLWRARRIRMAVLLADTVAREIDTPLTPTESIQKMELFHAEVIARLHPVERAMLQRFAHESLMHQSMSSSSLMTHDATALPPISP